MGFRSQKDEIAEKINGLDEKDPKVACLLRQVSLGVSQPEETIQLLGIMQKMAGYDPANPPKFYCGPVKDDPHGILIGKIVKADRVGEDVRISFDSFFSGASLVVGATRSGKTWMTMALVIGALNSK